MTIEVQDNGPYIQLTSKVSSNKWLSLFYEVDDTAVSFLKKREQKKPTGNFPFSPNLYRTTLNEGKNKVQKEFTFDYIKKTICYTDLLNKKKACYILKGLTFDPLSSLYYIRHLPLIVGKSVFVKVFSNRLVYTVELQVLRKEKIETSVGILNTFLVRSNMSSIGDGLFYKPGDVYIWVTDDKKRIPVLIEKRINELIEGKMPESIKNKIPRFLKDRLRSGSIKACIVKK
jgi:hypothetical protein